MATELSKAVPGSQETEGEMVEITSFMVLGVWALVVLGSLVVSHAAERKEWRTERKDLLNRIMARDYEQYSTGEIKVKALGSPMTVVGVEELVAKMQEQERDRDFPAGMPV
jgi:hypothetical protein